MKQFVLILFLILIFIIFVGGCENRGTNENLLVVPIYVYSLDEDLSDENIQEFVREADEIWGEYNIRVTVLEISHKTNFLSEKKLKKLFIGNSSDCSEVNSIVNTIASEYRNTSIATLFIPINNTRVDGRAHICDDNFIILNSNVEEWLGWNLAHEMGHMLNVDTTSFKYNLMLEGQNSGLLKRFRLKPKLLNQNQVDSAASAAERYN